jgi:hypothetical protein
VAGVIDGPTFLAEYVRLGTAADTPLVLVPVAPGVAERIRHWLRRFPRPLYLALASRMVVVEDPPPRAIRKPEPVVGRPPPLDPVSEALREELRRRVAEGFKRCSPFPPFGQLSRGSGVGGRVELVDLERAVDARTARLRVDQATWGRLRQEIAEQVADYGRAMKLESWMERV